MCVRRRSVCIVSSVMDRKSLELCCVPLGSVKWPSRAVHIRLSAWVVPKWTEWPSNRMWRRRVKACDSIMDDSCDKISMVTTADSVTPAWPGEERWSPWKQDRVRALVLLLSMEWCRRASSSFMRIVTMSETAASRAEVLSSVKMWIILDTSSTISGCEPESRGLARIRQKLWRGWNAVVLPIANAAVYGHGCSFSVITRRRLQQRRTFLVGVTASYSSNHALYKVGRLLFNRFTLARHSFGTAVKERTGWSWWYCSCALTCFTICRKSSRDCSMTARCGMWKRGTVL